MRKIFIVPLLLLWGSSFAQPWNLTGNGGTNPSVHFIGTTDIAPLLLRHNNLYAGKLDYKLRNYFIGNQSGTLTTGKSNVAFGDSALGMNTAGYSNVAIGTAALLKNTVRSNLVAVGDSALYNNAPGPSDPNQVQAKRNTAVGSKALYGNTIGSSNTALGFEAGYNTSGNANTAIGAAALRSNAAGHYNTALGANADVSGTAALTYATAVGAGASVAQSNSLVLGRTSDNVGIGTAAPAHALDVQANSVFNGRVQLRLHETENDYTRMRFTNTATPSGWEITALPAAVDSNALFNVFYSRLGNILTIRGDGVATPQGRIILTSDARLKRNITPLASSLQRLLKLNGYRYYWKDAARGQTLQVGLLAQEVETVLPELVNRDEAGVLGVNYTGLVPVLINGVKEQQAIIAALEKRLTALEQHR